MTPPLSANQINLTRIFWMRNIAIACQLAAIIFADTVLDMVLPWAALLAVVLALAGFNWGIYYYLRRQPEITHFVFFLHLGVDIAALAALLYFSGGASNPLAILFLLPLTVAAAILPGKYTWLLTFFTIGSYSLLVRYYYPLQMPHHHDAEMSIFNIHIVGMWLGFVLSALVIAYFIVGMGNTLRQQQQLLADNREQQLRDERLIALGTLAASTAHELGTPLNTMLLLVEELTETLTTTPPPTREALEAVQVLNTQIVRCKTALSTLSASAGTLRADAGRPLTIRQYMQQIISQWQLSRPGVAIRVEHQGLEPCPTLLTEPTLTHALTNILNNAADESPHQVEWLTHWDETQLTLVIRDFGVGLKAGDPAKIAQLGKIPYSDKQHGLGLGLFLSYAIVERLGGCVQLHPHEAGGSVTIQLPLAPLRIT